MSQEAKDLISILQSITPQTTGVADVFNSTNIVTTEVSSENFETAQRALQYIKEVNTNSVKRGEPHKQIMLSIVPERLRDMYGNPMRVQPINNALIQNYDPEGAILENEDQVCAYQFVPQNETNLLTSGVSTQANNMGIVKLDQNLAISNNQQLKGTIIAVGIERQGAQNSIFSQGAGEISSERNELAHPEVIHSTQSPLEEVPNNISQFPTISASSSASRIVRYDLGERDVA